MSLEALALGTSVPRRFNGRVGDVANRQHLLESRAAVEIHSLPVPCDCTTAPALLCVRLKPLQMAVDSETTPTDCVQAERYWKLQAVLSVTGITLSWFFVLVSY